MNHLKLRTFDLDTDGNACIVDEEYDTYPSDESIVVYGDWCYAEDAIEIIEKLQARIAELEGVVGELEWACN